MNAKKKSYLSLIILFIFFALLEGLLLSQHRFYYYSDTIVVPVVLILMLITGKIRSFISEWCLYWVGIYVFDAVRGLVFQVIQIYNLPFYGAYIIHFDRLLLGGKTFPVLLQQLLHSLSFEPIIKAFAIAFYGFHFLYIFLFPLIIWYLRPRSFSRCKIAMLMVLFIGVFFYALIPTIPPWYAAKCDLIKLSIEGASSAYNLYVPNLVMRFSGNPIGAMPSIHVALPALGMFICFTEFGLWGILALVYLLLESFSVAYLADHYLGDILAGILLGFASYLLFYRYQGWLKYPWIKAVRDWLHASFKKRILITLIIFIAIQFLYSINLEMAKSHLAPLLKGEKVRYRYCPHQSATNYQ